MRTIWLSATLKGVQQGPREKLIRSGVDRLSDLDLMMLILGRGSRKHRLQELARCLLSTLEGNNLPTLKELCQIQGIHLARATMLLAALELGRRRYASGTIISGPEDAFSMVRHLGDRKQEHFLCLTLAGNGSLIRKHTITLGLVNRTLIHPREVFAPALEDRAASILVAHNHPSGDLEPSEEDRRITSRLQDCGELMGIPLLDHIVFHQEGYRSVMA